jgi:hypothetical protein
MRAKLTDKQVADMRILRATNPDLWGYAKLAKHFGCRASTARDVVLYKTRVYVIVDVPPEEVKPDRFDLAAELRQKILDHINANGPTTSRQVAEKFSLNHDHAYRTTRRMFEIGELARRGKGSAAIFTALLTKSTSAKILRDAAYNKRSLTMMEEPPVVRKKTRPGHYIHHPDKPIPNQGGQGAERSRVYAGSSCGMI